jgi:TolB-like protein/Flp pilus assembly protein TadD
MDNEPAENTHGARVRPNPAPLFFSYARVDQDRVLPIIRTLEASGHAVWWDGLIEGGARFAETTEQALKDAPAVVVAWSATSIASHWVNDEATAARDRGVLVPVSIDGSVPPMGFRQFQVIDLSAWTGDGIAPEFQRVLRGVEAVATSTNARVVGVATPPPKAVAETAAPPSGPSRRTLMLTAAGGVSAAALAGAWFTGLIGGAARDTSIAVLPFEDIGGGAERAYFAEGLSAELRAQLSRNVVLRVIAQSSSAAAAEAGGDAAAIARRLGVGHLLEGNVRWSGQAARITATLIDRATASEQWSKTFDLTIDDIFRVQSEIAGSVSALVTNEIVSGRLLANVGGTTNAAAYDEYLRGRDLYARASSEEMDKAALAHFDAAIAADPRFAGAHAARARSLTVIGSLYGDVVETRTNYAAALVSARRAVEIAPDHAEAQSTLGFVLAQAQLDVHAARGPFDLSRNLGEGEASVQARFAQFAGQTGRFEEARVAIDRAVTLDPLNPSLVRSSGLLQYWARDYAAARATMTRALQIAPDIAGTSALMGDIYLALNQLPEAIAAFDREPTPLLKQTGLAIAHFRLGQIGPANAARRQIVDGLGTDQVTQYQQGQIAAQWNELDAAMAALAEARTNGDVGLLTLKVDPLLDPLRQRPDFGALLRALHFE